LIGESMLSIVNYKYGKDCIAQLNDWYYGRNWPTVYIFYNGEKAYVGETLDAIRRTEQHLVDKEFNQFTNVCFISDKIYNKSVILDLEAFLIKYIGADGSKKLLNINAGIVDHNYFYKEVYEDDFKVIWQMLIEKGVVKNTLDYIEKSELYKYSPYKSLNMEQMNTIVEILKGIANLNKPSNKSLIQVIGGAGTGKTILAVYLVKLLIDLNKNKLNLISLESERAQQIYNISKKIFDINKIGFVVPMKQLRETMKRVFNSIDGLDSSYILSPSEVINKHYDLLIVDESHRLYKNENPPRGAIKSFKDINQQLMGNQYTGTATDLTQLDWIVKCSKIQVLFYDSSQEIRRTDIGEKRFNVICNPKLYQKLELHSQMRCVGGNGYYEYVKKIIESTDLTVSDYRFIRNYDVKVFDSIVGLYSNI